MWRAHAIGLLVVMMLPAPALAERLAPPGQTYLFELESPQPPDSTWFRARLIMAVMDSMLELFRQQPGPCATDLASFRSSLEQLVSSYRGIRDLHRVEWTVAALDRIGFAYELAAERVAELARCPPPIEVQKLGAEACEMYRKGTVEYVGKVLQADSGSRGAYVAACALSQQAGISTDFSRHACSRIGPRPARRRRPTKEPTRQPIHAPSPGAAQRAAGLSRVPVADLRKAKPGPMVATNVACLE